MKLRERMAEKLKLPKDLVMGAAVLTVTGRSEAYIENYRGIIEYTDDVVRVKTGKSITKFSGKNLEIKCIQIDSLIIQGFITSIEFQF